MFFGWSISMHDGHGTEGYTSTGGSVCARVLYFFAGAGYEILRGIHTIDYCFFLASLLFLILYLLGILFFFFFGAFSLS